MLNSQALIPGYLGHSSRSALVQPLVVMAGIAILYGCAQIAFALPYTIVPVTGQTFGVALLSLLLGRRLAGTAVVGYLILSILGMPVLAGGAPWIFGPTSGYLLGMILSSQLVGTLSDRGFGRSFGKAFLAATLGSVLVFGMGLLVLSVYLPQGQSIWMAGLIPFIPGDLIKNFLASSISAGANRAVRATPSYTP